MMVNNGLFSEQEKVFVERTGKDFSTLYKKYYPKLIYFTARMLETNKMDIQYAEDISTDSFLTAFEKIEKYEKDKAQFSTWLFTIAKNLALQSIKNNKRQISLDVEYDEVGTTMKDFIREDEPETERYFANEMKAKLMMDSIYELKEPYKTVIEMREVKKMAYKDIAETLGKNLSTIKSQIRNGRAILVKETEEKFALIDEQYL
jgi:RNA polymerase sigma-70 factor (ECF subfamily)